MEVPRELSPATVDRLSRGFPSTVRGDVRETIRKARFHTRLASDRSFAVLLSREAVEIPERVYFSDMRPLPPNLLTDAEMNFLYLLNTRHCSGFIREDCLTRVISLPEPWCAPFIVKLAGEYVIEILDVIARNLDGLDRDVYGAFLSENASFFETIKRRTVSYWDCYYRSDYPHFKDYVGCRIIRFLEGIQSERYSLQRDS